MNFNLFSPLILNEHKSVKKKNEPDTTCDKDDVEKDQVKDLLAKIPALAKNFDIHRKIGEGTFSTVYLASLKDGATITDKQSSDKAKRWYAVKHLMPIPHPTRVAHELHCLRDIGGTDNVIGVTWCLRNLDNVVFIMPHMPHKKFTEYVLDMDTDELRRYMRALLTALRRVHTFGVIHRDVKPSNFLYDRDRERYALVDFGLAQHIAPPGPVQPPPAHQPPKRPRDDESVYPRAKRIALDLTVRARAGASPALSRHAPISPPPAHSGDKRSACICAGLGGVCSECAQWAAPRANRAGTQGYRPPEVLLKYPHQTTAVDVWAAGVVMASVLAGRYPFFRKTEDDMTALAELISFLGTAAMERTAAALGCRLKQSLRRRGICLRKLSAADGDRWGSAPERSPCEECGLSGRRCWCRDPPPPPPPPHQGGHTHSHTARPRRAGGFPDAAFDLADRLLEPDPRARISAADALCHPFFTQC